MRRYNLFLVSDPTRQDAHDFTRIAALVREMAPDIHAEHLTVERRGRGPRWRSLLRPTLTAEIDKTGRFRPLRGAVVRVEGPDKAMEYRRLEAAGLPVPRWTPITPDLVLDPAEWGSYVVEKPAQGGRGAYVRLRRAGRVRWQPPESYPEEHYGRQAPMLAQRFVRTGARPSVFRVCTFFGRAVAAIRYDLESARIADVMLEEAEPVSNRIVASAKGSTISLANDADVLALGEACHRVFPETPVLGADIMREEATGKLWVAEVNRGYCWLLSNGAALKMQEQFGLDFHAQFDGLRRAAEGAADATRRLAR